MPHGFATTWTRSLKRAAFDQFKGADSELDKTEWTLLCKNLINTDWKPSEEDPAVGCKAAFDEISGSDGLISKAEFTNLGGAYCSVCTPAQFEIAFNEVSADS